MKLPKAIFFLAGFVALAAATVHFSANTAFAATNCGFTSADIAKITAIQNNPALTDSQEIAQELSLRKQLVTETVTCAEADVQSLQTILQNTTTTDATSATIQSQLCDQLNDATTFYNNELVKLNTSGIAGTEQIAREILAWREGAYTSLEGQVNNFVLWTGNQDLFTIAQGRMDQTQRAVSFLESASANQNLQNDFNAAYSSFQTAKAQNTTAETALAHFVAPDESLALIKQSLDSLSTTYQNFFTVSKDITSILPN